MARSQYPHQSSITTRWKDNDVYGHVNNVEYYSYFDTVINRYLIDAGALDIHHGGVIGLCVESQCQFKDSFAFPETIDAGLKVSKLGNSSVRYEIALFKQGQQQAAALGYFVHVFVDKTTRRPLVMPPPLRAALSRLQNEGEAA